MGYFAAAGSLILYTVFSLIGFLFLMRLLLQLIGANFYNPVCQFFYKATNPVLMPLRKFLPPLGRLDLSAVAVLLLIWVVYVVLSSALFGRVPNPIAWPVFALAAVLEQLLMLLTFALIIRVVMSFLASDSYHPITPIIVGVTEPMMAPFRRMLPSMGGFDLSPVFAFLMLALARILILAPLTDFATWLGR